MKYALLIFAFTTTLLYGQTQFHTLNVSDGLSQNSIFSLCQDSIGYIWFGTAESGLNKFDGKNFTYYKHIYGDANSLASNSITKLAAGEKGDIWIGSNNGLTFYNAAEDKFSTAYYIEDNNIIYSFSKQHITSIKKGLSGYIWIVASGKVYFKAPNKTVFKECKSLNTKPVTDIEPINNNELLVTYFGSVFYYNFTTDKKEKANFINDNFRSINCLYIDKKGNIYVGSRKMGIAIHKPGDNTTTYFSTQQTPNMTSNYIRNFCEDMEGNIFAGSFNGLYHINTQTMQLQAFYSEDSHANPLSHNSIYDILRDKGGNLWFATYSGGVSIRYSTQYEFVSYTRNVDKKGTLRSNVINTFFENKHGIWIGTDGAGLVKFANGYFEHFMHEKGNPQSISSNHTKTIKKHTDDLLWIGGHGSGLDLFDQKRKVVINSYFPNRGIYSIARDKDSILWLASPGNGLMFLDEKTFKALEKNHIPNDKLIYAKFLHYSSKKNIMWICTTTSIHFYNFETNQLIEIKDFSLRNNSIDNIHHLMEDSKGNVWVATANGLLKINKLNITNGEGNIQHYNYNNLMPNDNIMSIIEDDSNSIWIATINSIGKLELEQQTIISYNHDYNIQTNDFSKAAAFKSKDGRLWFGGNGGFTMFKPSNIESNAYIPDIAFTELRINEQLIKPNDNSKILDSNLRSGSKLKLSHRQNNLSLSVAAFNYTMPDRNQYKWTLSNKDNINLSGYDTHISITNLPQGNYQLLVWASNNDNKWNPTPLELSISILPPWYKTTYAFLLYVIVSIIIIIIVRKIILERASVLNQLKVEKLQKIEKEKLHHQKVQFFTNISHEIRTPLSLISGPLEHINSTTVSAETKKHLRIATRNVRHLKKLIDELIDFRKLDGSTNKLQVIKLNIKEFTQAITEHFEQSLSYNDTPVTFSTEINERVLFDPVVLEKILFNLLYNAYKYNKNNQPISVKLNYSYQPLKSSYSAYTIGKAHSNNGQFIVITIEDKGIGIQADKLPKIFTDYFQASPPTNKTKGYGIGLAFVKKLVELHKGELKVLSQHDSGSIFSVKIPVGSNDYQNHEYGEKPYQLNIDNTINENDKHTLGELQSKKEHTVLIVEDNEELKNWMGVFLEKKYHCIMASNGQEGIEIALKKAPDIIISDVMMPGKNGYELCETLKSNVKTSHIPIILLTAKSSDEDKKQGISYGADAHISKPFDTDMLLHQVSNFLQLKKRILENYNANTEDSSQTFIDSLSAIDRKLIETVYAYISDNLSNPGLNIDDMAKSLYTSRSSLYRKIKSLTNTTPNEFIKDYRLKVAHSLIKDKQLTINEISESVGFQDRYYFKKCFVKKYGLKPEEL